MDTLKLMVIKRNDNKRGHRELSNNGLKVRFVVTCKPQEEGILFGGNNQLFQICG